MSQNKQADFFLPADLVARALANLAEREHDAIDALSRQPEQGDPDVKEELKFRLRDYEAFIKAGHEWGKGIRPVLSPSGSWLVPSRTTGGLIHEVRRENGYWHCGPTCKARQFHWHTALVLGFDRALELVSEEDDGESEPHDPYEAYEPESDIDPEPFPTEAPRELGRRLALARDVARRFNEELFAA